MKIESADRDINGILSSGYYKIPRFQRPYSWDKENVSDFWNDVVKREDEDYFIGSVVVYQQDKYHLGIVDGQQRLTTITILLCAIREALNSAGSENLAKGIHSFVERNNVDNAPEFIVSPETSYPYFQEHVQKFGEPDLKVDVQQEEENIKAAYTFFKEELETIVASIKKRYPEDEWREKIEKDLRHVRDLVLDLKVIFIKLENEDDAYLIFETLNTRGKDLATSDLVKNHLTKLIKTKGAAVDTTKEKWNRIRKLIHESAEGLTLDNFLHHYWLATEDYVALNKLFPKIKTSITQKNAKEFLDQLVASAPIYRCLFEPSFRKWKQQQRGIESALVGLATFRVKQQVPMTFATLRAYLENQLSKKNCEQCLQSIENFHFFFTAVTSSRSSGGISTMYSAAAQRLSAALDADSAYKAINELKAKLIERVPSYEEFLLNFSQLAYTKNNSKDRRLIKYILSKFQRHLAPAQHFTFEAMSIEHIVPQSDIAGGAADEHTVGQIGNLILLDPVINSSIGNKSFLEKRKLLKEKNYVFEPEFDKLQIFDEAAIKQRTERLAKLAYDTIWKI